MASLYRGRHCDLWNFSCLVWSLDSRLLAFEQAAVACQCDKASLTAERQNEQVRSLLRFTSRETVRRLMNAHTPSCFRWVGQLFTALEASEAAKFLYGGAINGKTKVRYVKVASDEQGLGVCPDQQSLRPLHQHTQQTASH